MENKSVAVSIVSGWSAEGYDVVSGVIVPSGIVVTVDNAICCKCSLQLKAGDLVALVRFVGGIDSHSAFHLACLPDDYALTRSVNAR